jgi:hypothetical protein
MELRNCSSAYGMALGKKIFTLKFIGIQKKVKQGLCFGSSTVGNLKGSNNLDT